ncbi:MAG TPA: hypothetical protein DGP89_02560 [Saprospirales bacterium]|nr:hypothetical protein [Saprospirales bacterium]
MTTLMKYSITVRDSLDGYASVQGNFDSIEEAYICFCETVYSVATQKADDTYPLGLDLVELINNESDQFEAILSWQRPPEYTSDLLKEALKTSKVKQTKYIHPSHLTVRSK